MLSDSREKELPTNNNENYNKRSNENININNINNKDLNDDKDNNKEIKSSKIIGNGNDFTLNNNINNTSSSNLLENKSSGIFNGSNSNNLFGDSKSLFSNNNINNNINKVSEKDKSKTPVKNPIKSDEAIISIFKSINSDNNNNKSIQSNPIQTSINLFNNTSNSDNKISIPTSSSNINIGNTGIFSSKLTEEKPIEVKEVAREVAKDIAKEVKEEGSANSNMFSSASLFSKSNIETTMKPNLNSNSNNLFGNTSSIFGTSVSVEKDKSEEKSQGQKPILNKISSLSNEFDKGKKEKEDKEKSEHTQAASNTKNIFGNNGVIGSLFPSLKETSTTNIVQENKNQDNKSLFSNSSSTSNDKVTDAATGYSLFSNNPTSAIFEKPDSKEIKDNKDTKEVNKGLTIETTENKDNKDKSEKEKPPIFGILSKTSEDKQDKPSSLFSTGNPSTFSSIFSTEIKTNKEDTNKALPTSATTSIFGMTNPTFTVSAPVTNSIFSAPTSSSIFSDKSPAAVATPKINSNSNSNTNNTPAINTNTIANNPFSMNSNLNTTNTDNNNIKTPETNKTSSQLNNESNPFLMKPLVVKNLFQSPSDNSK